MQRRASTTGVVGQFGISSVICVVKRSTERNGYNPGVQCCALWSKLRRQPSPIRPVSNPSVQHRRGHAEAEILARLQARVAKHTIRSGASSDKIPYRPIRNPCCSQFRWHECNLASVTASRRSVLTRSPAFIGIRDPPLCSRGQDQ
jgi:hypothetical protein